MKILMLSKDAKIFEKRSAVRERMIEYGKLFDELHIVIPVKFQISDFPRPSADIGAGRLQIAKNVFVYPAYSRIKLHSLWRAFTICEKIIRNLKLEIRNSRDIIVTAQDPFEVGALAYRVAKKLGVPLQLQVHADIFSPFFTQGSMKNVIRRLMAKRYLPRANCIRVVSKRIFDSLAELGIRNYESRTTIMPIFVDVKKILDAPRAPLPQSSDFNVLWVGRFEPEKNPMLAIHAFSQFVKKVPTARLFIVGEGSLRRELELQATSYKLQAHILFDGWKDTIAGYYKSVDVLLVTSLYEGYGMAMVEARIAGLLVVAPDVGVAKEVGAYITAHNAEEMAHALEQIYNKELPAPHPYRYPYGSKEEYFHAYKQSFERCLSNRKK